MLRAVDDVYPSPHVQLSCNPFQGRGGLQPQASRVTFRVLRDSATGQTVCLVLLSNNVFGNPSISRLS